MALSTCRAAADANLIISDLAAGYGRREIITDFSMDPIAPGSITAVLGPNGSGKSTLLKALAGLIPLRRGRIALGLWNLARAPYVQRGQHLVYVPQGLPTAVHLRVLESVLVAANTRRSVTGGADIAAVHRLLGRLGIAHLALSYLDELSGGQKQLVGLAQALIRQPRVLLLDEPLSALDLNYQFHVMDLLHRETAEHGLITLIALHDINIALRHTDRALLLQHGRLTASGSAKQVIRPDRLAAVYGVRARIEISTLGLPYVLIEGVAQAPV